MLAAPETDQLGVGPGGRIGGEHHLAVRAEGQAGGVDGLGVGQTQLPLPTLIASWPSESRRAPRTTEPPLDVQGVRAGAERDVADHRAVETLKVSAPEPNLTAPMIAGSGGVVHAVAIGVRVGDAVGGGRRRHWAVLHHRDAGGVAADVDGDGLAGDDLVAGRRVGVVLVETSSSVATTEAMIRPLF
jgi:hypothetical protein